MDKSLEDRFRHIMKYVREHQNNLFFMASVIDDDLMFRASVAAVMVTANDEDKERIEQGVQCIKALSALVSGIPVDVSAGVGENPDEILPLMKWWQESAA